MDIDSLQIKIGGDSTKAVSAIDKLVNSLSLLNMSLNNYGTDSKYVKGLDNLSKSFDNIAESVGKIDADRLKSVSSSIKSLGKSFKSLNENINNITFTKLESSAKQMTDVISKETESILSDFGISGKGAVNEVTDAFQRLSEVVVNGNMDKLDDVFMDATKALKENARYVSVMKDEYSGLLEWIQALNSSGAKVYLPFNPSEFIDDYVSFRATLGKAFTSDKKYEHYGDIAELVGQLNSHGLTNIDTDQGEANMFKELVDVLKDARDGYVDYDQAVKDHIVYQGEADDTVSNFVNTIYKQNEAMKNGDTVTQTYVNSMESLVENVNKLGSIDIPDLSKLNEATAAIRGLGGAKILEATNNLPQLTNYLTNFATSMNSLGEFTFNASSLNGIIEAVNKFGLKNASNAANNIPFIADGMKQLVSSMNQLGTVQFDTTGLNELVKSIGVLGGKSVTNAVNNLPLLTKELTELIKTLSTMPNVSQNIIDTVNAIGNLASQGQKVGSAMKGLSNLSNRSSKAFVGLSGIFNKTAKSGRSLAAMFGKLYASYFLLFRAFNSFKKAIDISASLTEVQNVVDKSFGDMRDSIEDFADTSIEKFGMSILTAKQVASEFQAMGNAMGITNAQVKASNSSWKDASGLYDNAADSVADMSINLTKLAADMGSFFNQENAEVAERLASGIYSGQARALRQYGIDLTQATIKEWALTQGIEANFKTMTQAEKTMLRYQYVMSHASASMGDFTDTVDTWANQTRLLVQNLQNLGATIGGMAINAFKPLVKALNQAVLGFNKLAIAVSNSLGKIFGWKYEESKGGVSDLAEDAEDASDGLDDAADSASKLKKNLMGIDELNIVDNSSSDSSSDTSSSSSVSADAGQWVKTDSLLKEYESELDNLYKLGDAINIKLVEIMGGINWESIYDKAKNFGKGLADFLNGLISPEIFGNIGRTIANSLNTAVSFALSFATTFEFEEFGVSIGTALNEFFQNFNFEDLADTLNKWVDGLEEAVAGFMKTFDAQKAIDELRGFLNELELDTVGVIISTLLIKKVGLVKFSQFALSLIPFLTKKALLAASSVGSTIATGGAAGASIVLTNMGITISNALIRISNFAWASPGAVGELGLWIERKLQGTKIDTSTWEGFWKDVDDFFEKKWELVGQSIHDKFVNTDFWKNVVSKTFEKAREALAEKDWAEYGAYIVGGIFQGFLNAFATFYDICVDFFDMIIRNIKDIFGIASPAKEMEPMGEYILLGIIEGFKGKFDEFTKAASEWYEKYVQPWFEADKWNFPGIEEGMSKAWNSAIEKIKGIWNDFADWINDKLTIKLDTSSIIGKGVSAALGKDEIKLANLPKFEAGGYPDKASLFWANENGVPELVGTMGGRPAVGSGTEITGIADAVYATGNAETNLLQTAIGLLQTIAAKDTTLEIDGREIASAINNRTSRNGYSFV